MNSPFALPQFHFSFETFYRYLKKAEGQEGLVGRLPFPQVLCLKNPPSHLAVHPLNPSNPCFQPIQELIQNLNEQINASPPTKALKTLQKIKSVYQNFINEVCQAPEEQRVQLLDVSPAFIHQLVKRNQLASIQALIEQKITIHIPDKHGLSPLHFAASEGLEKMVFLLLQAGADKEAQDREGKTPLHHAVLNGQVQTVRQLIEQGANLLALTHREENVLHLAASYGQLEETLIYLLTQSCRKLLLAGDQNGRTPLHRAVSEEPKERIVQLLLEQGALADARDNFGYTSLHWAAKYGHLKSAQILLAKGADPFSVNTNGEMPIDLALRWGQDRLARYLIDPKKFKEQPYVIPDGQELEGFYYQKFEEAYFQGDGLEILFCLQKISTLYLEKGQLMVTAHLLNNALSLAIQLSSPEIYQHYLLKKLEYIEGCYLQELCGLLPPAKHQNYLKTYRQELREIRNRVGEQLDRNIDPRQIQLELVTGLQHLLLCLIEESIQLMQEKPPTSFAIIGLGSMSREEMAPYSDIECAILIQVNTPANKAYFRRLSQLLALKIVNLGETKYDLIRPQRIGKHLLSTQSLTPHGFSLDSGGLSPLGKTGVYELIGTPEELSYFQMDEWLAKHEGEMILSYAMTSYCRIMGEKSLVDAYEKHILSILNTRPNWFKREKIREKRALELLKGHLEEFRPFLEEERLHLRAFDVKKDFYRPIQMVIGTLRLYYGLKSKNTLDILQELERLQIIGKDNSQKLQKTLIQILSLRLRVHLFYQNEKEILYYSREENDLEAEGLYLLQEEEINTALEIYRVLVPFHKLARSFAQEDQHVLAHASCYDPSIGTANKEAEELFDYDIAEKSYIQRTVLNPNNIRSLDDLQRIKLVLGQASEALKHNLDGLIILKNKYNDKPHPSIAKILINLGRTYNALGKAQKAIQPLKKPNIHNKHSLKRLRNNWLKLSLPQHNNQTKLLFKHA